MITASRKNQTAPKQFQKYLSVEANNTELLQFLLNYWQDQQHIATIGEKRIFVILRNEAYVIELLKKKL